MIEKFNIDLAAIPIGEIPTTLAMLGALQAQLVARLMTTAAPIAAPEDDEDALLTVDEVAQRLRRSTKWVYRRTKTLPFARRLDNRCWVFSQKGMERWLARQKA